RVHTNNHTKTRNTPWRVSGFVVSSYSRLRKPMVGSSVWVWWWGFRDHGFENTDSWWWVREHV
ncbi:hypothetical protein ACSGQV_10700, partial [Corynebacterium diphtheriae]|uniref:hypothetical protein n=1 Tax=Corynebacterium diphtheriae TaxID=1717 RepID=UPI003F4A7ECF